MDQFSKQFSPTNFEIEFLGSPKRKFNVHSNRLKKVFVQESESSGVETPGVKLNKETTPADISPCPYNLRPRDNHGFVIPG